MFGAVPVPTSPTVPAVLPLSLLEAIRGLDTPEDLPLDELSPEERIRRLGLSETVAKQIERYGRAAERGGTAPRDEVVSVFRLVSRRADAGVAFFEAGRRAADHIVRRHAGSALTVQRLTPGVVRRRMGQRAAARLAREILGGELRFREGAAELRLADPVSVEGAPDGAGCRFYAALLAELLRQLTGVEAEVTQERCRARGADACVWRAASAASAAPAAQPSDSVDPEPQP